MSMVLLALRRGLIYELDGNFGRAVHPVPILTCATSDWIRTGVANVGCMPLIFREDSFDPVTRIRRGRLYLFDDSHGARSIPSQRVHNYPFGPHIGAGGGWVPDCWYKPVERTDFDAGVCLEGLQINLGEGDFETLWRVAGVERITTGDLLFTLRALSSFGVLPPMREDLQSKDGESVVANRVQQVHVTLDKLVDAFHVQQPVPIVDVARETARIILTAWIGTDVEGRDLGEVCKQIPEKEKGLTRWAASIINRLHSRGKSSHQEQQEAEGKMLRPVIDEDAEASVQLIRLLLREIGWAKQ